jgi:hypothetical protein
MGHFERNVKIGAVDYTCKEIDDLHYVRDDGTKAILFGHILYERSEIQVEKKLSHDMKVITLWHEVIHAILEQAGIDEHPENVIKVLGYGMARVIRDNPQLVSLTINTEK